VTAYHGVISAFPSGDLEPRKVAGGSFRRLAFGVELHNAFGGAEAQAGHCVDDDAQPVDPAQLVVPAIRTRTVKLGEKFPVPGSAQFRLDFSGKCFRRGDVPLRQEPRVHQRVVCGDVHQRPVPQPVEQAVAVGRGDHALERVVFASLDRALSKRQQMQIVVAEHGHRAITQIPYEAQCSERGRAAVDEVAHEPQAIFRAIEPEFAKQRLQLFETALNIADRVGSHSTNDHCGVAETAL